MLTSALLFGAVDVRAQTPSPSLAHPAEKARVAPPAAPVVSRSSSAPTAHQPGATVEEGDIVARVAATNITASEVRAFVATLGAREQEAIAKDPALLSQAVRVMLANRVILKEASDKKWDQQPAVAARLQQIHDNTMVETYLQVVTAPPPSFPSEAELEKAYETNKTALVAPRQYRVAQIFIALGKDADKTTEDKAAKKLADVQAKLKSAGTDFAIVAKSDSDDSETGARGGEIGWLPEPQINPEIKARVAGLAVNAISEPIRLDDGWHIMKLLETKASYTRPLAEVHDALIQRLRQQSAEANRRAYVAKVLEQTPPAINEIALSKLYEADHPAGAK